VAWNSVRRAELNRRVQMTATKSWGSTLTESVGREVDYQVAAPTETRTPNWHRAKIAHQRVRMEGWRQVRLAQRQKPPGKKKKNRLDTHQPPHGKTWRLVGNHQKSRQRWKNGLRMWLLRGIGSPDLVYNPCYSTCFACSGWAYPHLCDYSAYLKTNGSQ
jgi:hypothetical protein